MRSLPIRQQGVSLVVTLVLVVLMSLLALYGAGILVLDTRSSANDFRAREAISAAESGLDQGFSLLNINRTRISATGLDTNGNGSMDAGEPTWTACAGTEANDHLPCGSIRKQTGDNERANWSYLQIPTALITAPTQGGAISSVYLMTPTAGVAVSGDSNLLVYYIVATGSSADGTSSARTKQGAYFFPLIVGNVDTPLAAAGNIPLSGNYSIITNPNSGCSSGELHCAGRPLSAWSDSAITPAGSFSSCQAGGFSGGACASSTALCSTTKSCNDVVENDPNFPDDLFKFLFGVDSDEYEKIKDEATVVADCSSLGTSSQGLIWVTGNCNPPGNVGTADHPVLLVVEGDTVINAGNQFYGLLFLFDPDGSTPDFTSNGNAHLHGAVMAYEDIDLNLTGGFVLEYDATVLGNLSRNASGRGLTRLPGSWSDLLQ